MQLRRSTIQALRERCELAVHGRGMPVLMGGIYSSQGEESPQRRPRTAG